MPALMTADEYNEARRALQDLTAPPDKAHIAYLSDAVIAECPKALSFLIKQKNARRSAGGSRKKNNGRSGKNFRDNSPHIARRKSGD